MFYPGSPDPLEERKRQLLKQLLASGGGRKSDGGGGYGVQHSLAALGHMPGFFGGGLHFGGGGIGTAMRPFGSPPGLGGGLPPQAQAPQFTPPQTGSPPPIFGATHPVGPQPVIPQGTTTFQGPFPPPIDPNAVYHPAAIDLLSSYGSNPFLLTK